MSDTPFQNRRRPTIRDVASLAEVGAGTVSRVLNQDPRVRGRTRERVLAAVAELGYHLDERGRALRAKRGNLLLAIVPFFTHYLFMEILREIDRATPSDTGTILTVMNVESPEEKTHAFEMAAWDGRLAGIISVSLTPPEGFSRLLRPGIPTVLIDVEDGESPSVVVDHVYGGRLGTKHLLSLGHERIGFVGRPQDPFIRRGVSGPRVSGYRQALEEAGIPFREEYFRPGEYSKADGYEQALHLLDLPQPPTAIFAASDLQAIGVLEAARERGMHLPDDLAVLGYNDIELAGYLGLSTVRLPIAEVVEWAMKLLKAAWANEPLASPPPLRPTLIVRETCGGSAHVDD
jgi:DNA-binding LacI/PurR family transcriptional regulator